MVMTKVIIIHQNCRLYSVLYCLLNQSIFFNDQHLWIKEKKIKAKMRISGKSVTLQKWTGGIAKLLTKSYRLRLKAKIYINLWFYFCKISCFLIKNLNYSRLVFSKGDFSERLILKFVNNKNSSPKLLFFNKIIFKKTFDAEVGTF